MVRRGCSGGMFFGRLFHERNSWARAVPAACERVAPISGTCRANARRGSFDRPGRNEIELRDVTIGPPNAVRDVMAYRSCRSVWGSRACVGRRTSYTSRGQRWQIGQFPLAFTNTTCQADRVTSSAEKNILLFSWPVTCPGPRFRGERGGVVPTGLRAILGPIDPVGWHDDC